MRFGGVEGVNALPDGIVCCSLLMEEKPCSCDIGVLGKDSDGGVIAEWGN